MVLIDRKSQPQNVPDPEISKLCFEYFKHFTTITTAAALVELALYQQLALNKASAIGGVGTLGLTLFLCIIGLVRLSTGAAIKGAFVPISLFLKVLMVSTAMFFLLGVVVFALAALFPVFDDSLRHLAYLIVRAMAQDIR